MAQAAFSGMAIATHFGTSSPIINEVRHKHHDGDHADALRIRGKERDFLQLAPQRTRQRRAEKHTSDDADGRDAHLDRGEEFFLLLRQTRSAVGQRSLLPASIISCSFVFLAPTMAISARDKPHWPVPAK